MFLLQITIAPLRCSGQVYVIGPNFQDLSPDNSEQRLTNKMMNN